jgi:hypothetical protein
MVHQLRSRRHSEDGAIAILAGILFLSLFLICALVVQLGFARDVRRQSQNASDASALAAAQALMKTGSPDFAAAVAAAKNYATVNFRVANSAWDDCSDPGRPAGWYTPSTACISFDSQTKPTRVRVLMPRRETKVAIGAGGGVKSLKIDSVAVASIAGAPAGLRPWGICPEQVPATANSTVTMVYMPGNGHTSTYGCSQTNAGGNWWLMRCPEDHTGGTPITNANVLDGCDDPVSPVPNQPTDNTLAAFLKAACPSSTVMGTGSGAIYPIWKMVSVEVCGFRLNKQDSTGWPGGSDPCTTKNTQNYKPNGLWLKNKEDGFFLVFRTLDKPLDPTTDPTQKAWLVE